MKSGLPFGCAAALCVQSTFAGNCEAALLRLNKRIGTTGYAAVTPQHRHTVRLTGILCVSQLGKLPKQGIV